MDTTLADNLIKMNEKTNHNISHSEDERQSILDAASSLKQKPSQFMAFWFQLAGAVGDQMGSLTLKYLFLLMLYASYILLLIVLVFMMAISEDQRNAVIDYALAPENSGYLYSLIVLAVVINALFGKFKSEKSWNAEQRRWINLVIDILRTAFHVVYLIFVYPFAQQNQEQDPQLMTAFWLTFTAAIIFTVRGILKWVHFLWGHGQGNLKLWQKPFEFDQEKLKETMEQLKSLEQLLKKFKSPIQRQLDL